MSDAIVVEATPTGSRSIDISNGRTNIAGAWAPEAGTWMPTELFLGGLASCMLANAMYEAEVNGISFDGMGVRVTGEEARRPTRFGQISVDLLVPEHTEDARMAAVERAARRCKVHNTLHDVPDVDISVVRTPTE